MKSRRSNDQIALDDAEDWLLNDEEAELASQLDEDANLAELPQRRRTARTKSCVSYVLSNNKAKKINSGCN